MKVGDRVKVVRLTPASTSRKVQSIGFESVISHVFNGEDFPYIIHGDKAWCWCEEELELIEEVHASECR